MFMFLSHPLDPEGYAWPGEPVVKTTQCTDVSDDCPFCSFVSELPNHCGTHMDAPRHFVKDGLSINDLPIDYFCHTEVALLEIPKGPAEGIYKEDLEPFADILSKVSFALILSLIHILDEGDKIGIIGINGTGKSTLLRIIAGEEEADEGKIIFSNGLTVGWLGQNPEFDEDSSILKYVCEGKKIEEDYGYRCV